MGFSDILYDVDGPVLTLTLNRPESYNALTHEMCLELAQAFDKANADDAIRAIIITGSGKGFCAGADLSAGAGSFNTASGEGADNFGDVSEENITDESPYGETGRFVLEMFASSKPTICAFNGPAVGAGLTITLPCDIRIASEKARFGFVFTRRGLVPEAGAAWFLPQLVGKAQALRWALSGRVFDAAEALAGGLVSEVVPPELLLSRAREIALEIAANTSPVAVAMTRAMIWRLGSQTDPLETFKLDALYSVRLGNSPDVREGVASFLEKRAPQFPGRVSQDFPAGYPWW